MDKRINNKTIIIGIVILIAICLAGGYGLVRLSGVIMSGSSSTDTTDADKLIGTWTESSAGTKIAFDENGRFSIMDAVAATYTVNSTKKTITLNYRKAYGGQKVVMAYTLEKKTLTMTNTSDNQSQTYQKNTTQN